MSDDPILFLAFAGVAIAVLSAVISPADYVTAVVGILIASLCLLGAIGLLIHQTITDHRNRKDRR